MSKNILLMTLVWCSLNVHAQEKAEPRIDIRYFQVDTSIRYMIVKVRRKVDRKLEPLPNLPITVSLELENQIIPLGSLISNAKGEGRLDLTESFNATYGKMEEYRFTARTAETEEAVEGEETITIIPGRITISTYGEEEKLVRLTVQSRTGNEWIPVEGAEVSAFIKRSFGELPLAEEPAASDESGIVEIPFAVDIPGDDTGNITLIGVIEDHDELGNLIATTNVKWGTPFKETQMYKKRSLWSTRDKTPLWLLIFPNLMIAGVWAVIVYLFFQIFRMTRATNET